MNPRGERGSESLHLSQGGVTIKKENVSVLRNFGI